MEQKVRDLQAKVQSLQKDVESKTSTIGHLHNALDAKSTTIGILTKHNREGGDLEAHITGAVQTKMSTAAKAKDDEIAKLSKRVKELESATRGADAEEAVRLARDEAMAKTQKAVEEAQGHCKRIEAEKFKLKHDLEMERSRLGDAQKLIQTLEAGLDEAREKLEPALAAAGERERAIEAERLARAALEEAKVRAADAEQRAEDAEKSAAQAVRDATERMEEERSKCSELTSQMRDYQSKAIELKATNDAMSEQLEGVHEEMRSMQVDHEQDLEELRKEIRTLEGDREVQWKAVTEQIDNRVKEMRAAAELEKKTLADDLAGKKEEETQKLRDLTTELDRVRLRCDAQEMELKALRDVVGDADGDGAKASPDDAASGKEASGDTSATSPAPGKRERARALREQSQFAFDEMAKRMAEVREEAESDKRRFQADFEQSLKERGAKIVEITNANDVLQTKVETLEQARDTLVNQRDELSREAREKDRDVTLLQAEIDGRSEEQRLLQGRLAVVMMVSTLHRGALSPAFSILRQCLATQISPDRTRADSGGGLSVVIEEETKSENTSTADGEALDEVEYDDDVEFNGGEDDEDEEEEAEEEEEATYGVHEEGQQELVDLLRSNTLNTLFTGAGFVTQNAVIAAGHLQEHVQNIVGSLDLFPQIYDSQLKILDRVGKGKDLRDFVKLMHMTLARCQRISSAISELCNRSEDFASGLQNLVRAKGMEWHLRSLRTAAQHEILLKLQRNQLAKYKTDYEEVLDQYGDQCEVTSELEKKSGDLDKRNCELEDEIERLKKDVAAAKENRRKTVAEALDVAAAAAQRGSTSTEGGAVPAKSMQGVHQMLGEIERTTRLGDPEPKPEAKAVEGKAKGKGKAKGPPLPGAAPSDTPAVAASADTAAKDTETTPAETAAAEPAAVAKGKAKGKAGPPPPTDKGAPAAAAEETNASEAPADAAPSAGKAKGPAPKGKSKGPPPPAPPGAGAEAAAAADGTAAPATDSAAPAPAKGKGPGKGGPPPPGKGGGPPAPGGKGPPAGGKGKGKGKGKGPDLPPVPEALTPKPPEELQPKTFHWTNVTAQRFGSSIFAKIVKCASADDDEAPVDGSDAANKGVIKKLKVDLKSLTKYFFKSKAPEPTAEELCKMQAAASKKKASATCLEGKKTQAVEIFLNGCGVTIEQVKSCVLDLNDKALSGENLEKVIGLFPNSEELGTLKEFEKTNDPKELPWGRAETFLLSLMGISNFMLRAECCVARSAFKHELDSVSNDVELFRKCLSSIVNSTALTAIFAMVVQIGNCLNYGSKKGNQLGFSLDTLQLLVRVEGFADKSYSLMRFIMESIDEDKALRDEAFKDMELCDAVSKLDFDEAVRQVGVLEKSIGKVSDAVTPPPDAVPAEGCAAATAKVGDLQFESAMRVFAVGAQKQVGQLRQAADEVSELCKQCLQLYAEKPGTPIGESLVKFAAFRKDMEEAKRQNLLAKVKRDKAEKRAAEKEALARAKAAKAALADGAPAAKVPPAAGPKGASPAAGPAQGALAQSSSSPSGGTPASQGKEEAVAPQMRVLNIKIPDRPQLSHALPRGSGAAGATANKQQRASPTPSAGPLRLSFGPGSRPQLGHLAEEPSGRRSLGLGCRPLMLQVSQTGRISIGVAARSAPLTGMSRPSHGPGV